MQKEKEQITIGIDGEISIGSESNFIHAIYIKRA